MNKESRADKNVFSGRNFRLVFFGALVSELGAVLYSFAVSFYILEISGNNAFLQGLYLALCGAVMLLFTPVGGVLGDRWNRAKIMFVCDYLRGGLILTATLLMMLLPGNGAQIIILFSVGILGNAVGGIFSPASGAMLPNIVEENRLQQANAYFSVKSSFLSIFGIILAGILYAAVPILLLFMIVGICYLLSGVSEMFIRYAHVPKEGRLTLKTAVSDMREGMIYLKAQKAVMAIIAAALFVNFFMSPVWSNFVPYFVKTDIAFSSAYLFSGFLTPELWSSVFSMLIGISSLVGSVILSARKQKEKCGHKTALWLCATAAVMIIVTAAYWFFVVRGVSLNAFLLLFCLACLLIGFFIVCVNIPLNTALMRTVERDKLSKVTSIISIVSQGLIPIASVLAGIVLQCFGSTPLLLVCSLGFAAAAMILLFNPHAKEI